MRVALIAACIALGCSESSSPSSGSCVDEPARAAEEFPANRPPLPSTCTPKGGRTQWFAVTRLLMGDVRRTGIADANAWRDLGFDLDSVNTTKDDSKTSKGTCKRIEGSPTNVLADGNDGADNNVGQHVVGAARTKNLPVDTFLARALAEGTFALLLRVENLTTVDNASAPAALYLAHRVGEDRFAIDPSTLEDQTSIARPRLRLDGHVTAGYWSTRFSPRAFPVQLPIGTARLDLTPTIVAISMRTDGTAGTIAGALHTAGLLSTIPTINGALCGGTVELDALLAAARNSSDLVLGAPNLQDTTRTCDATSFGFGFEMRPIPSHDAAPVAPVPPTAPRCSETPADAGAEDVTDAPSD